MLIYTYILCTRRVPIGFVEHCRLTFKIVCVCRLMNSQRLSMYSCCFCCCRVYVYVYVCSIYYLRLKVSLKRLRWFLLPMTLIEFSKTHRARHNPCIYVLYCSSRCDTECMGVIYTQSTLLMCKRICVIHIW